MSVEFYRGSPGKFDSRTPSRKTLSRWTGRSRYCYTYNTTTTTTTTNNSTHNHINNNQHTTNNNTNPNNHSNN